MDNWYEFLWIQENFRRIAFMNPNYYIIFLI